MSLILFDANKPLHQDLFEDFKNDLKSDINSKDHLYGKYFDCIEELEFLLKQIAIDDLGCSIDIEDADESYWSVSISDSNPTQFKLIIGFEYINYDTEKFELEFIKLNGEILIEDEKLVILNIIPESLNYSSLEEYKKYH